MNPKRASTMAARVASVMVALALGGCGIASASRHLVPPPPARLGAQVVAFSSRSGSHLRAWFSAGHRGRGAVLLLHGVGADRTQMLERAQFLHDAGFTVLAPDFQAQGESSGEHVTFGALESLDAASALAYLRERSPGERIGVIGVSMGGAAALLGPQPLSVDAMVLESVYPTFRDAVADRLEAWTGPLGPIGRVLAPMLIKVFGPHLGVREHELQPIERIGESDAPLLLLAGTADPYTHLPESVALFLRSRALKEMWAITGAKHEDLYAYTGVEYERRVGGFLARHLTADASARCASATTGADHAERASGATASPSCAAPGR